MGIKKIDTNHNKGFSVIEVLLAVSLFGIVVMSIISAIVYVRDSSVELERKENALQLAKQGIEAARDIRNRSFSDLIDGDHGIVLDGDQYIFIGDSDSEGLYTRVINISSNDQESKTIKVKVEWDSRIGNSRSVELSTILTNWKDLSIIPWQNPTISEQIDLDGTRLGRDIEVDAGNAYISRDPGVDDFALYTIAGNATYGTFLADSHGMATYNGYLYILTSDPTGELLIADIQNPLLPSIANSVDLSGTNIATSIAINDGIMAIGSQFDPQPGIDELMIYQLTPSGFESNPNLISSLDLDAGIKDLTINEIAIYLASENDTQTLQTIDITDPATPILVQTGTDNYPGETDPSQIIYNENNLVIALNDGSIYTYDATSPLSPQISTKGTISVSGDLTGLDISADYIFIATDTLVDNFLILDLIDISNPTLISSTELPIIPIDLAYNQTNNKVYILTNDLDSELILLSDR